MKQFANNETNLVAWREIIRSGTLVGRQLEAWTALDQWGPMTGRELDDQVRTRGLWKRLPELRAAGLVVQKPARLCRISQRQAIVWQAVAPGSVEFVGEAAKPREFWICIDESGGPNRLSLSGPFCDHAERHETIKVREVRR